MVDVVYEKPQFEIDRIRKEWDGVMRPVRSGEVADGIRKKSDLYRSVFSLHQP